jgi:glycosyltransferase involved in cell wall biosynthesis
MRVVALVQSADHVCCRYRVAAFAWELAERGLRLELAPIERRLAGRLRQIRAAGNADLVILQRKLLPVWQLAMLRKSARKLVFDFDDAVFQRDSYSRKPAASAMRLLRFWATVYAADAVTAGNDFLAGRAAAFVGPDRVHTIPTCVEPQRYPPARHDRHDSMTRLVWIGQQSTLPSLHCAQAHLAAAAERLPGVQLWAISDRFPELAGVRCVGRPWSDANEADELARGDVGVSWLPDDDWSRGKCGLKVLQYMAAGLPVVANPVGMHLALVAHGRTGFLASTPQEWADAIARLAADPGLRRTMGAAGREMVERHYSASSVGPRFARLLARLARGACEPHTRPPEWLSRECDVPGRPDIRPHPVGPCRTE